MMHLTGNLVKYSSLNSFLFCHNDSAAPGGKGNLEGEKVSVRFYPIKP